MIYLDMDGVIVDWYNPVAAMLCHFEPYPCPGNHNCIDFWGLNTPEFWDSLNREWYANLEWTLDGKEILQILGDVTILTSCTSNGGCAAGKIDWLQKHLPGVPWIITPYKEKLADGVSLLVDDCNENIDKWNGPSILVPRVWNRNKGLETITYLKEQLCLK
jgi:hypothetical protein